MNHSEARRGPRLGDIVNHQGFYRAKRDVQAGWLPGPSTEIAVFPLSYDPRYTENRRMRTHGKLTKWNEQRGFGFIEPATAGAEIFVHITAFPRDGTHPRIGELISFEIDQRGDGKQRAVRVMRPGSSDPLRRRGHVQPSSTWRAPLAALASLGVIAAMGWYAYTKMATSQIFVDSVRSPPASITQPTTSIRSTFTCDGRKHCSQMTSCAEATYFIQHCPDTQMDGDHDGRPCESQWCSDSW